MSDKKLLKNCPFCGGENIIQTYTNFVPSLLCSGCGARMIAPMDCFGKDYEKLLADKWNTRVPMQKIVERLEEEYKDVQMEYSEAKYLLMEMSEKDSGYISQNYRKDMNEGMCFAFDDAIDIVKEEGGFDV